MRARHEHANQEIAFRNLLANLLMAFPNYHFCSDAFAYVLTCAADYALVVAESHVIACIDDSFKLFPDQLHMPSSNTDNLKFSGLRRLIISCVLLIAISLCIKSLAALSIGQTNLTQIEQDARNASASSLYLRLTRLEAPIDTASITQATHEFIRDDKLTRGATLLNANGELIAQLGSGNEALSNQLTGTHTARIPIQQDGELHAHVILAFTPSSNQRELPFQYLAFGAILVTSLLLIAMLWRIHRDSIPLRLRPASR
jgi:hypothetical protein